MDYPEVGEFFDGFEIRIEDTGRPILVCTTCDVIICTVNHGDSLGLLGRVAYGDRHNH
jgi:hypothetical protein